MVSIYLSPYIYCVEEERMRNEVIAVKASEVSTLMKQLQSAPEKDILASLTTLVRCYSTII